MRAREAAMAQKPTRSVAYIVRGIDPAVWRRVRARAALEGETVREAILRFLRAYVAGKERRP
jgi:hypothetical protein